MDKNLTYVLVSLAGFVIASITAEYVSRKIWPRAQGN